MTALKLKKPDRVPILFDNFYKLLGYKLSDVLYKIELSNSVIIYCQKLFGHDLVIVEGIHAESEAMGTKLEYYEDSPPSPVIPAVQDYAKDMPKLKVMNPWKDGKLPLILEQVRRLKEVFDGRVPIAGYVQGVFRHTCILRGAEEAYKDLIRKPDELSELMDIATDSLIVWAAALVEAGADIIYISDPTSSGDVISRKNFKEFVFPFLRRQVRATKRMGVPVILHICGDTNDRIDLMADTGVDAISIEAKVDLAYAKKLVGNKVCIIGNVSPLTFLEGTARQVEEETKKCISKAAEGGGYILAPGCVVPPDSPIKNLWAYINTGKKFGSYNALAS